MARPRKLPDEAIVKTLTKLGLPKFKSVTVGFGLDETAPRVEEALRATIARMHVLERKTVIQIAEILGITHELVEARIPFLSDATRKEVDPLRACFRDMQLMDIAAAIDVCRKIIQNPRENKQFRMLAMDRMLKLYDRGSKSEGTDRHKEKLELSGASTAGVNPLDLGVMTEIIELSRRRHALAGDVIDVQALPVGVDDDAED